MDGQHERFPGGEFGMIARFAARVGAPPPPAGPGDDAAVLPEPHGRIVATTDLLVEGVHFRTDWSSAADIGHRAAAANLADVAAMGAAPTALLIGVALPADLPPTFVDGFADGLRDECAPLGVRIVGGDTVRSPDRITVAITALGELRGHRPVTRGGARPGDDVVLVARVGWAAAGLSWLQEHAGEPPPVWAPFVTAHRRPRPPYDAGPALARVGAHALCDVSDGLVADAGHLAAASEVGIELDSAALRDRALDAVRDSGSPPTWELTGGDDHALLAAVPAGLELGELAEVRRIGRVVAGRGVRVDGRELASGGYEHFGG